MLRALKSLGGLGLKPTQLEKLESVDERKAVMTDPRNDKIPHLPVELIIRIFSLIEPVHRRTSLGDETIVFPDLCSAARTCWLWAQCAQPIILKQVVLSDPILWTRLHQAIDPRTLRGRLLASMVSAVRITYRIDNTPSPKKSRKAPGRHSKPSPPILEQLIQRCSRLLSLNIRICSQGSSLSFSPSFALPLTLGHLTISLLPDWTCCCCDVACQVTPLALQLIASAPSVKSLHLDLSYNENWPPPLPSMDYLPPTYKLHTFSAYQYDHLSRLVLLNSRVTLRELALKRPSHLAQIAKDFPNVTSLKFDTLEEGDSLIGFTKLEKLHWTSTTTDGCSFVHHLPPSLREIRFRCRSMRETFVGIMEQGRLPNLRLIQLEKVSSRHQGEVAIADIDVIG